MKKKNLTKILNLVFYVLLVFFLCHSNAAKAETSEQGDGPMIGFDKIHSEYFSPEEIYIQVMVDIRPDSPLRFDQSKICQQMKDIIKANNKKSIGLTCVNTDLLPITNLKNLYVNLRIKEEVDENIIFYSIVLLSEHKEVFPNPEPKRYSLLEGFNYRFVPYTGKETQKKADGMIKDIILGLSSFLH